MPQVEFRPAALSILTQIIRERTVSPLTGSRDGLNRANSLTIPTDYSKSAWQMLYCQQYKSGNQITKNIYQCVEFLNITDTYLVNSG